MNNLLSQQRQFASYLRNPAMNSPPAGVELRRMEIYRDVFFRNIHGLLSSLFPVLKNVLPAQEWQALVRDFYANHRCTTPFFPAIAGEFVEYLSGERSPDKGAPFVGELAHFEWMQLLLQNSPDELPESKGVPDYQREGCKPVLSPLCLPLVYDFPVQGISKDFVPAHRDPAAVYLLLYRNRDDQVKVIESDAATFRLLQLLGDEAVASVDGAVTVLAGEMMQPDVKSLSQEVIATLQQFLECGVLVMPS